MAGRSCACEPGYEGDAEAGCTEIDACAANACGAYASCTDLAAPALGDAAGRTCACEPGYEGDVEAGCTEIVDCDGEPCLNGGTCVEEVDGYHCECLAGYAGFNCETAPSKCPAGACGAPTAGTCVDGLDAYSCDCEDGYYGTGTQQCKRCQPIAHCNQGMTLCTGPAPEDGECLSCNEGYGGPHCEIEQPDWYDTCSNDYRCGQRWGGGTCEDTQWSVVCTCAAGYYGTGTQDCKGCDTPANCISATCAGPGTSMSACGACQWGYMLSAGVCVPEGCGLLGHDCPAGFSCNMALAAGSSYTAFCVGDGTVGAFGAVSEMVYVPGGTFWMGCNPLAQRGTDPNCEPHESPQHEVTLSPYAMDRTEVSRAAYKACVDASGSGCPPPAYWWNEWDEWGTNSDGLQLPVRGVTWDQATAYCAWRGKRLCTEAEWERAARGGCETVHEGACQTAMRKYPWGNTPPTCSQANFRKGPESDPLFCSTFVGVEDVDRRAAGASPYGALNLSGNVWEWTSDWLGAYAGGAATNPTGAASGSHRVVRGGDWSSAATDVRAGLRGAGAPDNGPSDTGFRCCRSYP